MNNEFKQPEYETFNEKTLKHYAAEAIADPDTEIPDLQTEINLNDNSIEISNKKLSWLTQIKTNFETGFSPKPLYVPTAKRFQQLAGIKTPTVARLTIANGEEIPLTDYPSLFEILRYKICGFKYEVLQSRN